MEMMMGVNINCKKQDFIRQILDELKTIETRNTNSLKPYIGKRVGLVRTGCGKATLEGFATIERVVLYDTVKSFRDDYDKHMVAEGSSFDITKSKKGVKYGYVMKDVEKCDPVPLNTRGIIARRIEL